MATYWVATDGDDGDPGTEGEPWLTVGYAATAISAGDTVIFKDGTYNTGGVSAWTSGTVGDGYCTFQSENRRGATWQLNAEAWLVELSSESYIRFQELILRGDTGYDISRLVTLEDCDHIVLDDCELTNTVAHCVYIAGGDTNIIIQDCEIHSEDTDYFRDGIYLINAAGNEDITIDGCEIYHVAHGGINCDAVDGLTITNCEIHDTMSHGISVGDDSGTVTDVLIEGNTIYGIEYEWGDPSGSPHNGIRVHDDWSDIIVAKNEIWNCDGRGIDVRPNTDACNLEIYNNTIYACDHAGDGAGLVQFNDEHLETDPPEIVFKNNILYSTLAVNFLYVSTDWTTELDADYNLYYATGGDKDIRRGGTWYNSFADYKAAGYEPHTVIDDNPDFVTPGSDFTLQSTSPAIDAGVDVGYEYEGEAPDIGAHEYEEEEPPPTEYEPIYWIGAAGRFLLFDRGGKVLASIQPDIEMVSWRLNEWGMARFSLPYSDAACTAANLRFGNRVLFRFENGLPDWGGVIDTPRGRDAWGVTVTAYTGERILWWRRTPRVLVLGAVPGEVYRALIKAMNATYATGVLAGTIWTGGNVMRITYHFEDVLGAVQKLASNSGCDFEVRPLYPDGQGLLAFRAHWYESRGWARTREVSLTEGRNVGEPKLDEQGTLGNRVYVVGGGSTWGPERPVGIGDEVTSQERYGLREYTEVQSSLKGQDTVTAVAAEVAGVRAEPKGRLSLVAVDADPGRFADYDLGDMVGVRMFLGGGDEWAVDGSWRVRGREWRPMEGVCRVELGEE